MWVLVGVDDEHCEMRLSVAESNRPVRRSEAFVEDEVDRTLSVVCVVIESVVYDDDTDDEEYDPEDDNDADNHDDDIEADDEFGTELVHLKNESMVNVVHDLSSLFFVAEEELDEELIAGTSSFDCRK